MFNFSIFDTCNNHFILKIAAVFYSLTLKVLTHALTVGDKVQKSSITYTMAGALLPLLSLGSSRETLFPQSPRFSDPHRWACGSREQPQVLCARLG